MLRNYILVALRTLRLRLGYATINIVGFAVGLAAVLLIGLWVQNELSYDDFHHNSDRTYRVLREFDMPQVKATLPATPSALAPALEDNVAGLERVVRTRGAADGETLLQRESRQFLQKDVMWVDDGFLDVFSFPLERGEAALNRPNTALITSAMAQKLFSGADPIGETIQVGEQSVEVTGILQEVPTNSSITFSVLVSLETLDLSPRWGANDLMTFVLLEKGVSKSDVAPRVAEAVSTGYPQPQGVDGNAFIPHLQPVTDIHFRQGAPANLVSMPGGGDAGDITYVWLFSALGLFVLILACVNFANLATARSADRANEVGVRKALGADRSQLAGQFLGEALVTSSAATLLAVLLAWWGTPFLNALSGQDLSLMATLASGWVFALPVLAVGVALAAGAFPAFALSRFEAATVLRGNGTKGHGGQRFRQALVVFQFAVTIFILAGAAVVHQQLSYMRSAGLGFNEQNIVVIENTDVLGDQVSSFMQEIERIPGVSGKAASSYAMPGDFFWNGTVEPQTPGVEAQNMDYTSIGWDYTETLGIEMVAGRPLSRERADSASVLINVSAAKGYGWTPEEAIGKKLAVDDGVTIVGVTEDFHFESLHKEIYPLMMKPPNRAQQRVAIRLVADDPTQPLASMRETWDGFSDLDFEYTFLESSLEAQYKAEDRVANVFTAGAILAVIVACMGLLGLAAFTAERRRKEIGVRKALGASVQSIVALLSKEFLVLVVLGFIVAVPPAWYGMSHWLDRFAYRTDISPLLFLGIGALALVVALSTVSWRALRAARLAPTDALQDT